MQSGDLTQLLSAAKNKWSQAGSAAASTGGLQIDTYA
jgi:hypothetical protein